MPTMVASGQSNWNTRKVVMDEWGQASPLNIGEMEAAMEYGVGYTEAEGLSMRSRFKLIGNAFHAGMLRHLLLCYVSDAALKRVLLRDDVRQKGRPSQSGTMQWPRTPTAPRLFSEKMTIFETIIFWGNLTVGWRRR